MLRRNNGSDEVPSRRKVDHHLPQKLDRAKVRRSYNRSPYAIVDVVKDGKYVNHLASKQIGNGGLVVCGPNVSIPDRPDWAYENPVTKERVSFLPDDSLFAVHAGEQRYFMRYRPGAASNPLEVYLDLTQSELRDRLMLQNGMRIVFTDGKQETVVSVELGQSVQTDAFSAWHRRIASGEFWALRSRLDEGSSFADDPSLVMGSGGGGSDARTVSVQPSTLHTQYSSAAVLSDTEHSPQRLSGSRKPRRVTWGSGHVLSINAEGERSLQQIELKDVEAERAPPATYPATNVEGESLVKVFVNGQPFLSLGEESIFARSKSVIVAGGTDTTNKKDDATPTCLRLPFAPMDDAIAAFSFGSSCCQMIIPRLVKPSSNGKIRVLLAIPSDVMLPLQAGDLLVMKTRNHGEVTLKFRIPKLSRAPPSAGKAEDCGVNPEHFLTSIAVEGTHQLRKARWNGSVEAHSNSEAVVVAFPEDFFRADPSQLAKSSGEQSFMSNMVRIGRADDKCNISLPDPHLSRLHAVISRPSQNHFVLVPVDSKEGKKAIYLLCGKTESHHRPPVALRSGDCICLGRSEFKVVYQQRGDRKVCPGPTSRDELEARLNTIRRRLNLAVKGSERSSSSPENDDEEVTSLKDAPMASEGTTDDLGEDELVDRFKTLNTSASEQYGSSKSKSSMQVEEVPVFRDIHALLAHFEMSNNVTGPVMILMSIRGPKARQFFFINPVETTIGNSLDADICISNDRRMSPFHCRIYFDPSLGRWLLDDLHSRHGTFLKIDEPTLLCSGDVFVMGLSLFRIYGRQHDPSLTKNQKCTQQ